MSISFSFFIVFITNVILVQLTVSHLCESTGTRVSTIKQSMPLLLRLRIFDLSSQLMCKSSLSVNLQTCANTCYASSISHLNSFANPLHLSARKPWPIPTKTPAHILYALTNATLSAKTTNFPERNLCCTKPTRREQHTGIYTGSYSVFFNIQGLACIYLGNVLRIQLSNVHLLNYQLRLLHTIPQ